MKRLLIFLILFTITLFADTYIVDDDYTGGGFFGTDTCVDGDHKYNNLTDAINDASNDSDGGPHTIKVCPGEYDEGNLEIKNNLNNGEIINATSTKPLIKYNGTIFNIQVEHFNIDGLKFEQDSNDSTAIKATNAFKESYIKNSEITSKYDGISISNATNLEFKNLIIKADNLGINLQSASGYIRIFDSEINGTSRAISLSGSQLKVINSKLNSDDIALYQADADSFIIKNSEINGSNKGFYVNIVNNESFIKQSTFIGNYGVYIENANKKVDFIGNKFKDFSKKGIYYLQNMRDLKSKIYYNCFYANGGDDIFNNDKSAVFNDGFYGNYWGDCEDNNDDGYCDENKTIQNYGVDDKAVVKCHFLMPADIEYRMDEFEWDSNESSYDVENSGSLGLKKNATALNDANTTYDNSLFCKEGNFTDVNASLKIQNSIEVDKKYSISFWIKFPIDTSREDSGSSDDDGGGGWFVSIKKYPHLASIEEYPHLAFFGGGGDDSSDDSSEYIYAIADLKGSDKDFIYLKHTDKWQICIMTRNTQSSDDGGDDDGGGGWFVSIKKYPHLASIEEYPHLAFFGGGGDDSSDDSSREICKDFNISSLDGWHMLSFVVDDNETRVYLDDEKNLTFDDIPSDGNLSLVFNSDKGGDDDVPNEKSIGTLVDEFKFFSMVLDDRDIENIYNREKDGKDYYTRNIRYCATKVVVDYRFDKCDFDSIIKDYSGNNLDMNIINTLKSDNGKVCRSGVFNKDNDVNRVADFLLTIPGARTYMAWIKREDINYVGNSENLENIFTNQAWYNALRLTEKDHSNPNKILFQLKIDGEVKSLYSNTEIKDTSWHQVVGVYNGSQMLIYIDGELDASLDVNGDVENDEYYNKIGSEYNNYYFNGDIDEVKVFRTWLSSSMIKSIYNLENSGKSWDNNSRDCPICDKQYKFDVWDINRNITDRNISTKIVAKEFNLTLAEVNDTSFNDDFNGTVCSVVFDSNNKKRISEWNATYWSKGDDVNTTNIKFLVKKAVKSAKVYIYWKKDVYEDNSSCSGIFAHENNETNSTDNFAIRPDKFEITNIPDNIKAGKEFNITIKALDYNGNPTKDYNESIHTDTTVKLEANISKSGCKNGELEIVNDANFTDGEANVTLKYSEVGDINVSIKEVNESEFAEVDEDDTTETLRFIKEVNKTISVSPHHFDIKTAVFDFDKESNFTYLDSNVGQIYSILEINITAENQGNETTKNYNSECYAKDINISINKDILQNDINVTTLRYFYTDAKDNSSNISEIDKDENISILYKDSNFTTDNNGSTHITIYFNFDRNISNPSNPFEINISEINVSDGDANGSEVNIGKVKFYYGGVIIDDIYTLKDEFDINGSFVLYDNREGDKLLPNNSKEIEYNWWENSLHKEIDGNISDDEIVVSKDYNASNTTDSVEANVSIDSGIMKFHIKRSGEIRFVVIHLLSPNLQHLWYSKYNKKYDISNNSTCVNHFCFSITWNKTSNKAYVGSGEFNGTESNITDENSSKKTGVKIFR